MKSYAHILRAARSTPWAIEPSKLDAILAFLEMKAAGGSAGDEILAAIKADSLASSARAAAMTGSNSGSIAVLPLFGLISHRTSMINSMSGPGGTSIDKFAAQFRQCVDRPDVRAIVIDVDSPGGTVDGVAELADEVYRARSKKTIVAVADCTMASAAYWIACSASELVASPSSLVGSIGGFASHQDISKALEQEGVKNTLISAGKYKTEGNSYEPLSDEARGAIQGTVDSFYSMFVSAVARGRGVGISDVRNGFGQGRMVAAQDAVRLRMADRVATLDQVLAKYGLNRGAGTAAITGSNSRTISGQSSVEAERIKDEHRRMRLDLEVLADGGSQRLTIAPRHPVAATAPAVTPAAPAIAGDDACACPCEACVDGDCEECDSDDCTS
jgi:signal peptide peptidase SppA